MPTGSTARNSTFSAQRPRSDNGSFEQVNGGFRSILRRRPRQPREREEGNQEPDEHEAGVGLHAHRVEPRNQAQVAPFLNVRIDHIRGPPEHPYQPPLRSHLSLRSYLPQDRGQPLPHVVEKVRTLEPQPRGPKESLPCLKSIEGDPRKKGNALADLTTFRAISKREKSLACLKADILEGSRKRIPPRTKKERKIDYAASELDVDDDWVEFPEPLPSPENE